jgi:hypothetical protein
VRWPDLLAAALARAAARPALAGFVVRKAGQRRRGDVPCLTWTAVAAPRGDGTDTLLLQVGIWAPGPLDVIAAEREVRAALDLPAAGLTMDGLRVFSRYEDARDHEDAEEGASNRSIDFRLWAANTRQPAHP